MKNSITLRFDRLGLLLALLLAGAGARAEVALNGVFGEHMVIQRNVPVPVWGKAAPGEKISVSFASQQVAATADSDGNWRVNLSPLAAGGPFTLEVNASNRVVISDVLVGDVWVCSGQSNMEFPMGNLKNSVYSNDLATADYPAIRHGAVAREPSTTPRDSTPVKWTVCHPTNIAGFTAVGYYFGRELERELKIPIGLLHTSWGGTSVEGWTSREALDMVPDFAGRAARQLQDLSNAPALLAAFTNDFAAWEKCHGREDLENAGESAGWAQLHASESGWRPAQLTTRWADLGVANGGIIWLRKTFIAPPHSEGKGFAVDLGWCSEQFVTVYFNGEKLGEFGRTPPRFFDSGIRVNVPGRLVQAGTNVLAVRIVAHGGGMKALSQRGRLLGFAAIGLTNVTDDCLLRVEREFAPLVADALSRRPAPPRVENWRTATTLYNGMLHPLIPFSIKGVVWYQGEQDAWRAQAYRRMLPLMVNDWRRRWGQGDFPFYITQLANWQEVKSQPAESAWAEQRESQWFIARSLTNSGLAVTIDIGDPDDIHPLNKREVGRRLALLALAQTYGRPVECSGPVYDSMHCEAGVIRLNFLHAKGLCSADGKPLRHFAVAGQDRKFYWADAWIDEDAVVVASPEVPNPVAVRYAWADSPEGCNLSNASGLPAIPFRTDGWAGLTSKNE